MTDATQPSRPTFTATFLLTPAEPGTPEKIHVVEESENAARNVGLVRAMGAASWLSYVYGAVTIRHIETGRLWVMNVKTLN